jgi:hypothetical protein
MSWLFILHYSTMKEVTFKYFLGLTQLHYYEKYAGFFSLPNIVDISLELRH